MLERLARFIQPAARYLAGAGAVALLASFGAAFAADRLLPGVLLLLLAGFWLMGLSLFCFMFAPRVVGGTSFPSRVSDASPFMRIYSSAFITLWFAGLMVITVAAVVTVIRQWVNN